MLRRPGVEVLEARGFVSSQADFARWAAGRGRQRLLMEDFYRDARRRHGVLLDGGGPVGGRWNLDEENRQPPPADGRSPAPEPWWPDEDEIDAEVRADLDRWEAAGEVSFVGDDGPRLFPVTRDEALHRLHDFVDSRLGAFGPHEDAMLRDERWLAHSLLSPALNLGLLDPLEVVTLAEQRYRRSLAEGDPLPLSSVEGFVRQVMGWRDYVWHMYWHLGRGFRGRNHLGADRPVPGWLADLDDDAVDPACLGKRLGEDACPFTAGYWAFLDRTRERLAGNARMRRPLQGLDRLADLPAVVEQERRRGTAPP